MGLASHVHLFCHRISARLAMPPVQLIATSSLPYLVSLGEYLFKGGLVQSFGVVVGLELTVETEYSQLVLLQLLLAS